MKRYLVTLLLAIVLAALATYVSFVELPMERAKTQAEAQQKQLLPFKEREITGLTVKSLADEVRLAAETDHAWKVTAPIETEADVREVDSLVRALVLGKVSRVVGEKGADLAPFGLDRPSVVLTVTAGDRQETLSIGDSGPLSSSLYALRASDGQVLLTDLAPKDFLNKTLFTFRRKEVLRVDQAKTERLRLTFPQSEIVLYRVPQGAKERWQIRFPIEAPADQTEVRLLLQRLEDLKALGFVDPGPERDALAKRLTTPQVKVTLHAGGADQTLKLFQLEASSGEAYAVTTNEAPIYRISPGAIKDLTKELFALRDKRLLGVDYDEVAMLGVKTRDEQYVLINQSGTWVLEDQPDQKLNQEKADLFVSRVVALPAELRVVERAGPLAPYGLTAPSAEFTATSKDGKTKGRLVLGSKVGGLVYAMGQGLPGIHQARADILTQVPTRKDLLASSETGAASATKQ
ncbi:DUF4340 domain-containing protein [Nitrospira sp. Kam-Ns4a]